MDFTIDSMGQIKVGADAMLDYEMPRGAEMSGTNTNDYMVTATATDPEGASDMITVTITVTDVDEEMTLLDRYDGDDSGRIDKDELADAIFDYNINQTISKSDLASLVFNYEIGG